MIQEPGVEVLKDVDYELGELQVHVLHPRVTHVEDHGDHLPLLLSVRSKDIEKKEKKKRYNKSMKQKSCSAIENCPFILAKKNSFK